MKVLKMLKEAFILFFILFYFMLDVLGLTDAVCIDDLQTTGAENEEPPVVAVSTTAVSAEIPSERVSSHYLPTHCSPQ